VETALEGWCERRVHHAVTLDAALARKSIGHDIKSEVRFAALAPAGVAGVLMRLIRDRQDRGLKTLFERLRDPLL